jgi:heptosyltransferase-2
LLDALCGPAFQLVRGMNARRPATDPRSILIVQLDHIGDAVLSTPMLRALRERFPNASIDVLASQSNREIFETCPHVRRVHVSHDNWLSREPHTRVYIGEALRLTRSIRPFRYDVGIDARGDFLVALVLWLAGIPRRLGWACGGGGFLLTDVASWEPSRHETESRRAVLERLGIRTAFTQPELFPSWADSYHVRESLAALPDLRLPLIVVHVGAGTKAKRWPSNHLAELVERLVQELVGSVILVGDSADQPLGRTLSRGCPPVIDWTGSLTLMQMAALLGEADLFIGTDSGPAHIAAAMGTPSVALFSGTNRAECWRPVGTEVHVLRRSVPCSPCHLKECPVAGHPCMSEISPAEVFEVARQIVKDSTRRQRCSMPASAIELEADLDQSA